MVALHLFVVASVCLVDLFNDPSLRRQEMEGKTDFHLAETLLATLDFAETDEEEQEEKRMKRRGAEYLVQLSLR